MTTKDEALKLALEALENNKRKHHYCEDTWYSCPKHEDGCANDSVGDECNCGADEENAEIDKTIAAIKEALAQPPEEPVAIEYWLQDTMESGRWVTTDNMEKATAEKMLSGEYGNVYPQGRIVDPSPPQREWVGLTGWQALDVARSIEIEFKNESDEGLAQQVDDILTFARAIEAALKEKNT